MIPHFDDSGLLPPGIHPCTLADVESVFCWTDRRAMLLAGLKSVLADWWQPMGLSADVLIDGSFVRRKPLPEDIDVVFRLGKSTSFHDVAVFALRCQTERQRLKMVYHVDVWPSHPLLPNDLVAFFQYAGDKAGAELRIDPRHPKGILRIEP